MAELRYAHVFFKDQMAGILKEEPEGGTSFTYADNFHEEMACVMPRTTSTYTYRAGLLPFFQQMTPEGWLRSHQARSAEIDTQDDFGILLAFGYDCIGAVSVRSANDEWKRDVDEKKLDAMTWAAIKARKTMSGVQPKLYATEKDGGFIAADDTTPADWIAKFPSNDVPDMVLNEELSLTATRLLLGKKEVTLFRRGTVENIPGYALLVKRFDRTPNGEKLRLEDFTQILNVPRGRNYDGKYHGSFEQIAVATRQYSDSTTPLIDMYRLFQRIFTFTLLGNCDCHLKNWSLLETPQGLRLSPVYDVVNTYIYAAQGYTTEFGLDINGRRLNWDQIDGTELRKLGKSFGLNDTSIDQIFAVAGRKQKQLFNLIEPVGSERLASADLRRLYADSVRAAYERILT
jgi:serine/threonine-protein kinase HipA